MSLVRLAYHSKSTIAASRESMIEQVTSILDASRRNNRAAGLTGSLLFDTRAFVQVIEGKLDDVLHAFQRIARDPRHCDVEFVQMTPIRSRLFDDWWMGCAERTQERAAVFAPYLTNGAFDPAALRADDVVSLMVAVRQAGYGRDHMQTAA